jgi:hypothetical protein
MMMILFSAAFYLDGVLGRAHGDGGHSYPNNNNYLQINLCARRKAY